MRLIDAEAIDYDDYWHNKGFSIRDCQKAQQLINEQPTVEERKHGEWEHDKLFGDCAYVCSFCHTIWTSSEIQNMHYCPTCGADMRGRGGRE